MNNNYIQEIQSLRGIAIIMVFLFHLNQEAFSYGYLGVDIFFVISGFVITKIIYEKSEEGTFTFKDFFVLRFLRLIPAIFFMVLIISFFMFLTYSLQASPDTQISTGLLSLIGLSNFYLHFLKNDYFNSFDQSVFEHTWSLSIEFQFYLIYPILLFFLYKFFRNKLKPYVFSLFFILVIFLFYNFIIEHEFFYQTESRIWEFIVGCLTFFLYKKKLFNNNFIVIFSFLSLILFFYTEDIFYLIIFMCFITSFVILSVDKFSSLKLVLNNKLLYYIGNISYSLYLWHLPVIFFANTFFVGLDYYFFSISVSLIISFLSVKFIENPFRKSLKIRNFTLTKIFTLKKISFVVITFIVFFIYIDLTNSRNKIFLNQRVLYQNISNKLNFLDFPKMTNTRDETCHENYDEIILKSEDYMMSLPADCFKKNNNNKLIYFFGDSSMSDFFESFKNSDIKIDKLFTSYNNSSFWKPILNGYDFRPSFFEPYLGRGTDIATIGLSQNLKFLTKRYDEVFLVLSFNHKINYNRLAKHSKYYEHQEKVYSEVIKILPKNIKLIFIKDTPQFKYSARNCFIIQKVSYSLFDNSKNNTKCDHDKNAILKKMNAVNEMFNNLKINYNLTVINLDDYFCENKKCTFYKNINSTKFAKKFDGHHFTTATMKNISHIVNEKINQIIIKSK